MPQVPVLPKITRAISREVAKITVNRDATCHAETPPLMACHVIQPHHTHISMLLHGIQQGQHGLLIALMLGLRKAAGLIRALHEGHQALQVPLSTQTQIQLRPDGVPLHW